MKTKILNASMATVMLLLAITSCKSPEQKVINAEQEVVDANADLEKANEEYLEDIKKYKLETAEKIAANEKKISEFNTRIANEKAEAKKDYAKKIEALEKKNSDMKLKLDNYNAEGKEKWETFKAEFNRDLNELGESLSKFFN